MFSDETIKERFQHDKEEVALLRRNGLTWQFVLPLSIHQTLFPAVFQINRHK